MASRISIIFHIALGFVLSVCCVMAVDYSIDNTRFSGLVDVPLNPEFAFRVQCNDTSFSSLLNGIYAQSDNNTGFVSVFPQYQHASFQSNIVMMQSHPFFHYDSAISSWLFGNITWTYAYVYSNASYPPPFGWAVLGDPTMLPFNTGASVSFLVPAMGDSFLVSDTSISVQWSSCDVGVYPHLLNLSLWQNGVMLSTLATNIDDSGFYQWSNGVLVGTNYTIRLVSSVVAVFSGSFSLGAASYFTSATMLDLCRSCQSVVADQINLPNPTAPFNLWNRGYRHQSLYRQSILSAAGLNAGDNVTSVAVLFSSSCLNTLSLFTVRVYWNDSAVETTEVYLISARDATPIFGPVDLSPDRMRQNQWLSFPVPKTAALGPWNGARSLLVEIAYKNYGARSNSGSVFFHNTSYMASAFGDGTSNYPYNDGSHDAYASMFMKLRLTRSVAIGTSHALSSKPISVEPVPTVLRVTGSASYDPSYGIYTAQRANGFQDANLIYRKFVTAATPSVSYSSAVWSLASQFTAGVYQWQLTPPNVLTPTYVTTLKTTAEWPQDELVRWQDFTGSQANHITVRAESILYLSFTSSSMPPIRSPRYIYPLVSQSLLFIPLLPIRLFTLDLMAPNLNSSAYGQVLDLSSSAVLVTVSVTATYATSATSLPSYAVSGVWQLPLRTNAFLDVSMEATTSSTIYAGYTMSFQLPATPATTNLFAVRLINREFPQSRFAFGDSIQFNVAYTPQLVLVSPLVLTFAPNLSLALSYSVEYSFPGAQAIVELWQLTGYNTAQSTPLPLTVNASWSLNSVIFATVMVSPAPETLVWTASTGLDSLQTIYALRMVLLANTTTFKYTAPFSIVVPPMIITSLSSNLPVLQYNGIGATPSFTGYPLCTATLCLRWQSLYYAADFLAIGLQAGGQISAVGLKVWGLPGAFNGVVNARIAYALVSPSMTVVTQTFTPTTVVFGPSTIPQTSFVKDKYFNFVLTSAILWDGVSNLVIEWSQANPSQITDGGGIKLRAVPTARSIFEFSNSWIIDATLSPWPFVAVSTQQPVVTVADISLTIGIGLYIDEGCSASMSASCGSNGVCNGTSLMCQCSPQYFGVYCTRYCNAATTCFGNGVCSAVDGSCLCTAPFAGASCSRYNYQPLSGYIAGPFKLPLADPFNLNAAASLTVMGGGGVVSRRVQWMVLAVELAMIKLQAGFTLTHIVLPLAALPIQSLPNLQLSMGLTVASNFISTPDGSLQFASNLSIVYQTALLTLANVDLYRVTRTTQTIMIPLITAFYWDGMSNVVMEIRTTAASVGLNSTALAAGGSMNAVQLNTDQRCLTTLGTVDGVPSLLTCTTIPAISFASFVAPSAILYSISPTSGPAWGGTRVTITGVYLGRYLEDLTTSGASVSLGDLVCQSVEFQSSSSIVCVTRSIGIDNSKFNIPFLMTVRTLSAGLFASRLAPGVGTAAVSFSYNPTPSIGSIVPSSGEFEGGTRVNIFGQYLGRSSADIAYINIGNYSCVDVHWWSASNVDCVSTNLDGLPGYLPILLVTRSGDRSVYTLKPVNFEFVKGLEVFIDPVTGSDVACVTNSTIACRTLAMAMSTYTQTFTRYVLHPGVHLIPVTGLTFAADRMRLVGVGHSYANENANSASSILFAAAIVDCQQRPCFNLSNGHVPVVLASLKFRSAVGGILSITGFSASAIVESLPEVSTFSLLQQAHSAVSTKAAAMARSASVVDLAQAGIELLITDCVFDQSAISPTSIGSVVAPLLSLMSSSNVLIRDSVFSRGNVSNGVVLFSGVNNVLIVRCNFSDNLALQGSALTLLSGRGLVMLISCIFSGNRASLGGGAALLVQNSTVVMTDCAFTDNMSHGFGGAVSITFATVISDRCSFVNNRVVLASMSEIVNAEEIGGAAVALQVSTLVLSRSILNSNSVIGGGRGGAARAIFSILEASACVFSKNSAASGGAVSLETKSSGVFIANNSFILNHATGAGGGGHGGAVYASSTQSLMVSDTMVVDNVASSSGGGVFVQNADQTVVKDSIFAGNQASAGGGGLACVKCELGLSATLFDSNSAHDNGGGALQLSPSDFAVLSPKMQLGEVASFFVANSIVMLNNTADFAPDFVSTAASMRIFSANQTIVGVNTTSGSIFNIVIQVELLDSFQRRIITESTSLVRCLLMEVGSGRLIGTTSVPLSGGVATFDALGVVMTPGFSIAVHFESMQAFDGKLIMSPQFVATMRTCVAGEYLDSNLQQCVICSGPSFSDRAIQTSCQPCPIYSLASADGRLCLCYTQGRLGLVADATAAVNVCVEDMAGAEQRVYEALAALLMVAVLMVGGVLWRARGSRVVHAANPMFLGIILIGIILIAVSDLFLVQPQTPVICMANIWLTNIAFTACFGAMFVKTFHSFLSRKNLSARTISMSNSKLLSGLTPLFLLDVVILTIWSAVAPYTTDGSSTVQCHGSSATKIFSAILFITKAFAAFVATYQTVRISDSPSAYMESNFVAANIYNMDAFSVAYIALLYGLAIDSRVPMLRIEFFVKYFIATASLLSVFLPKIYFIIIKNDKQFAVDETAGNLDTGSASSTFAPATTHAFDLKAASEHELTVIEMQPTFPVELHMTEAQNQLLAPLLRQKQCLLDAVHHNMELAAKEYASLNEIRRVLDTSETRLNDLSCEADYVRAMLAALPVVGVNHDVNVPPSLNVNQEVTPNRFFQDQALRVVSIEDHLEFSQLD